MTFWRIANKLHRRGWHRAARLCSLVGRVVTGAYIPAGCQIGEGTKFAYGGSGVVLNELTVIGRDCLISPGVLLGSHSSRKLKDGAPILEDDVHVYQNAVIVGGVRIGKGARVNANCVVVDDVPAGAVVLAPTPTVRARKG